MRIARIGLLAAVLAGPAAAQTVPGPVAPVFGHQPIAADGLGPQGIATQGVWWAGGFLHVFLFTGPQPEPYGSFTVNMDPVMQPPAAPHPLCVASPAWTGPEYTPAGYRNPHWPTVSIQQSDYVLGRGAVTGTTTFRWQAGDWLEPWAAYSVILSCADKG